MPHTVKKSIQGMRVFISGFYWYVRCTWSERFYLINKFLRPDFNMPTAVTEQVVLVGYALGLSRLYNWRFAFSYRVPTALSPLHCRSCRSMLIQACLAYLFHSPVANSNLANMLSLGNTVIDAREFSVGKEIGYCSNDRRN